MFDFFDAIPVVWHTFFYFLKKKEGEKTNYRPQRKETSIPKRKEIKEYYTTSP
jgi:hypothetical protein